MYFGVLFELDHRFEVFVFSGILVLTNINIDIDV
jgi:hypothetical protein